VSKRKNRPGPALRGTLTAMVTPFSNGVVDQDRLAKQIDRQIAAGVEALCPAGTTGESATLSLEEQEKLIGTVCERVGKRIPVVAGVGTNNTFETVQLAKAAKSAGADAGLVVVPYYNRPSGQGLVDHFRRIWEESGLPIVVYNVPSRTGNPLTTEVYDRLAGIEGVFAVKESSGDLNLASHLLASHDLNVLAGDDSLTVPMMAMGASGVVSVAANIIPGETKMLTDAALTDDWVQARNLHKKLFPLWRTLFLETNPIPVKCAMRLLGLDGGEVRLPLGPAVGKTEEALRGQLQSLGMLGAELDHYIDPRD
jgi:4-hydroxy-tetrahydrodipicolinate synthase